MRGRLLRWAGEGLEHREHGTGGPFVKKICDTSPSRPVPDASTTEARASLTAQFGWDGVTLADMIAYENYTENSNTYLASVRSPPLSQILWLGESSVEEQSYAEEAAAGGGSEAAGPSDFYDETGLTAKLQGTNGICGERAKPKAAHIPVQTHIPVQSNRSG